MVASVAGNSITGNLAEYFLSELLQFLEQGSKTGLLSVRAFSTLQATQIQKHYIWFKKGQIVAAADRLDYQGLKNLIKQRGWVDAQITDQLSEGEIKTPIGLHLKSEGLLQAEHLKMLFFAQVMKEICALFELTEGEYKFQEAAPSPMTEMTGLSMTPTEVTLSGLRILRNWSPLTNKLPDPTSVLIRSQQDAPRLLINKEEQRVLDFANQNTCLSQIATELQLPADKVQQIAFRLITVGVVGEVPVFESESGSKSTTRTPDIELRAEAKAPATEQPVSASFLQNLVGFLNRKKA
jgi:hypothetical protein